MKKYRPFLVLALILGAMLIYICHPTKTADLHLKLYFTDTSAPTDCSIYYATAETPSFADSRLLHGQSTGDMIDVLLPCTLCQDLTALRLDLSQTEELIGIERVELCSAGFIQEKLDASEFLAPEYISDSHHISVIQQVTPAAYIGTSGSDPYVVFHEDMIALCKKSFSQYTGTKAVLCALILLALFLARKKVFSAQ